MKLLRVHIISAATCGGLLDGFHIGLRSPLRSSELFEPLCLIGPNGAGKSQFLQILAEMFQSAFHRCLAAEERVEGNPDLQFEIEYLITPSDSDALVHVKLFRKPLNRQRKRPQLRMQIWNEEEYDWVECDLKDPKIHALLPSKVVGYTSGDNETLSLPFLVSRSGYADEVGTRALKTATSHQTIPDTRLMLIDYSTHLEVLVANLLLGDHAQQESLLAEANLQDLHSFRCIIQLAHSPAPKAQAKIRQQTGRKGIQLTSELETYLDQLKRCATCYEYDDKTETYILDYWVNAQTKAAFHFFWNDVLHLYSALHKLAMLNDLVLPRDTRLRLRRDTKTRRFASRLPEPQDENKVFRFEQVKFRKRGTGEEVDYVSLSDGEHQLGQLLGTFCMLSFPNVLFLLDEAESHFNPQWRVQFISRLLDLPTQDGDRRKASKAAQQDCLITTHAPFIPSDMKKENVFIFSKNDEGKIQVRNPDVETFGTNFDTIIEECFDVRPPISQVSRDQIKQLMESDDAAKVREGLQHLGNSVEKVFLADHLRQLTKED